MLQHLFVGQSGAKVGQFGVKMAPIWGIIVSRMQQKSKKMVKTHKSQNLIKTQCSSICLWDNLEPKWRQAGA